MDTKGSSFVSVYIPASEYSRKRHGETVKPTTKSRSIRRIWNRLSRMQKSFLLVMLFIILIFTFIVTTTSWIPADNYNAEFDRHSNFLQNSNQQGKFRAKPEIQGVQIDNRVGGPEVQNQAERTNTGARREQLTSARNDVRKVKGQERPQLLKPASSSPFPTLPRALQPDFGDPVIEDEETHNQIAENIRSVISLDPVIPLGKKKHNGGASGVNKGLFNAGPKKADSSNLKFNGPENSRQQAVADAFLHAWNGYRTYAWGRDNLKPLSQSGSDWFALGLTLIDSLDTMYIMGFQREYFEARDWVEDSLNFDGSKNVNLFETTIRVMGGLLSAYHLSGDQMFLKKAEQLGSILNVAFKTPSGVPYSDVNLKSKTAHGPSWNPDSTTSEVTTVQLEFRDLSRCTKNPEFEQSAMNVSTHVHTLRKVHGLVPININPTTGNFRSTSVITLGARGDSYYEYLLKQWIQTGKTIDFLKDDYLLAVEGMRTRLLQRTYKSNLTFMGELEGGGNSFKPKMDHLVCYLPGTLALGVLHGLPDWHLVLAKELLYTCYLTYKRMPTGLAPEITYFRTESDSTEDFYVRSNDAHNLLRPETVESLWYLYQITGDKMYQDWGWEIFESFMKYTRNSHGFNSISSVLDPNNVKPRDMMESFFLGETLKYFYLLFSDKVIFNLKTWVFNTEAHPFPVYDH
ncbi:unnamed protein product [Allacma fusca]|uniref:Endoplasmic reticulum mannosyl-oligosaccharide 1,2-alpha-mannosidase n=1 Tax=Allacma fusca TaxID=39272 RepID=A0A8J2L818_9HEXA|nr:unnamed protein product [Allacma fusca]